MPSPTLTALGSLTLTDDHVMSASTQATRPPHRHYRVPPGSGSRIRSDTHQVILEADLAAMPERIAEQPTGKQAPGPAVGPYTDHLAAHPGVLGISRCGSHRMGIADVFSDLDLWVFCADDTR